MPTYDPNQDHRITLDEAKEMTARYRDSSTFGGRNCGFFGSTALQAILNQTDAVGLRIYYGLDANDNQVLILVGITEAGNDLYDGELAEVSVPCPAYCDDQSPLMI